MMMIVQALVAFRVPTPTRALVTTSYSQQIDHPRSRRQPDPCGHDSPDQGGPPLAPFVLISEVYRSHFANTEIRQ